MGSQTELRDGWLVKELPSPPHDIPELTRQATVPGEEWLTAAMPAQVHDVLLAHARIPDRESGETRPIARGSRGLS